MTQPARGPGLAKTTKAQLFHSREIRLVASSDARWGQLFETADVMSEGAPRALGAERAYFGSSNIVLLIAPEAPGQTPESLASAVALDPHVRLRAMRVARREAAQRADGPLDRVRTEITVSPCALGVAVHVDVEAVVLPERRAKQRDARDAPMQAAANAPATAPGQPALPPSANGGVAATPAVALPLATSTGGAIALPAALPELPQPTGAAP